MGTASKRKPKSGRPSKKAPTPRHKHKGKPAKPAPKGRAKSPHRPAKASSAAAAKPKAAPAAPSPAVDGAKKPAPKGITIVSNKPAKKAKPKARLVMPTSEPLFTPGAARWKPLIPSGPKASPTGLISAGGPAGSDKSARPKTKLARKELERYRAILLQKRRELIGDVSNMEDEALLQSSGSLSHLPQHMAEQGSDAFDQAMSLDLAAVDRNLIREIEDALKRINDGTYGVCERTGEQIKPERLNEIPWARYTIEAARALERSPYQV